MSKQKVMVFGVFDLLHDGHIYFINEAAKLGELTIVVTPDQIVEHTKGAVPAESIDMRVTNLKKKFQEHKIVHGDASEGTWSVLHTHKPDIIALGYDQRGLKSALKKHFAKSGKGYKLIEIGAHFPEKYKSSIKRQAK